MTLFPERRYIAGRNWRICDRGENGDSKFSGPSNGLKIIGELGKVNKSITAPPPVLAQLFVQLAAEWGRVQRKKEKKGKKKGQTMDSSIPILLPVSSVYAHTLALSMLTRFLEPAELPIPLPLPRRFSLPHHTPPPATHTHIYGKGHSVAYLQQFKNVFGHLGPYFQHTI